MTMEGRRWLATLPQASVTGIHHQRKKKSTVCNRNKTSSDDWMNFKGKVLKADR